MSRRPTDHSGGFRPTDPDDSPPPGRAAGARSLPRYRLVLEGGKGMDMIAAIRAVMEVLHLGRAEANHKIWEAHNSGRAPLLSTHRERGELYVEQLLARGLRVVLEPAAGARP